MSTSDPAAASADTSFFGHPRGLATLFFTEMWERFSYYGMRAILTLYLAAALVDETTGDALPNPGMGLDDANAGAIYGLYTGLVYLLSLPGGWVADNLWGQRKSVYVGGWIIMFGHFSMAIPSDATFFAGLILIVLGTGLLKPNVSTIVGDLYDKGDARRDSGFSIFYMGINMGALFGPLIVGFLAQGQDWQGWHYGFGAAGVGMAFGLWQYKRGIPALGDAGVLKTDRSPEELAALERKFLTYCGVVAAVLAVFGVLVGTGTLPLSLPMIASGLGALVLIAVGIYFAWLWIAGGHTTEENKRLGVILWLFVLIAIFWSGFEQAGSSLNLYTERLTELKFFGGTAFEWDMLASWLQSVNAFYIVVLAPVFATLWLWLARMNKNPSTPLKAALGLLLLAAGFFVIAWGAANATEENKANVAWLVVMYFLHTVGELLISPVGLAATTKLAPEKRVGQMMGIWFVGASLGNIIAGQVTGFLEEMTASAVFFAVAYIISGVGIVALLASPFVKKLMGGVQ